MKFLPALLLGFLLLLSPPCFAADAPTREQQIATAKADMKQAIEKVAKIVNQPVVHLKRNYAPGMVTEFSPGWFHEGAETPDFNAVDVRRTQELPYDQHPFVTSNLNPGEMFIGRDLEFNSMTKYFYTDRTVPKKKLTQAEMLEINRLYRIIGSSQQKLAELQAPPLTRIFTGNFFKSPLSLLVLAGFLSMVFMLVFRKKKA